MNKVQSKDSAVIYPQSDYEEYIERLLDQQQAIAEVRKELQEKIINSITK